MDNLQLSSSEKKFVEQIRIFADNGATPQVWIEAFKLILATAVLQLTTGQQNSVSIPFLGVLHKDGTFVPGESVTKFLSLGEGESADDIEDILISRIDTNMLAKLGN